MKRWETPRTVVQGFEANEYVAACWGVGCDVVGPIIMKMAGGLLEWSNS